MLARRRRRRVRGVEGRGERKKRQMPHHVLAVLILRDTIEVREGEGEGTGEGRGGGGRNWRKEEALNIKSVFCSDIGGGGGAQCKISIINITLFETLCRRVSRLLGEPGLPGDRKDSKINPSFF